MSLKSLQANFPKWEITRTTGGAWVGRRKRPMLLTNTRIDQGLRDTLIEESEVELRNALTRQQQIDEELESGSNTK